MAAKRRSGGTGVEVRPDFLEPTLALALEEYRFAKATLPFVVAAGVVATLAAGAAAARAAARAAAGGVFAGADAAGSADSRTARVSAALFAALYVALAAAAAVVARTAAGWRAEIVGALADARTPTCVLVRGADGPAGAAGVLSPPAGALPPGLPAWATVARWEVSASAAAPERARLTLVLRRYAGRAGNAAFQYASARARAALLDVAFEAPALPPPFERAATRVERWAAEVGGGGGAPRRRGSADSRGAPPTVLSASSATPATAAAASSSTSASLRPGPPRHEALARPRECCAGAGGRACGCEPLPRHWLERWAALEASPRLRGGGGGDAGGGDAGGAGGGSAAQPPPLPPRAPATPADAAAAPALLFDLSSAGFRGWEAVVGEWLTGGRDGGGASAAAAAAPRGGPARPPPAANDVAVHVRAGDIAWGGHAAYSPLPHSFYRAALWYLARRVEREGALRDGTSTGGSGNYFYYGERGAGAGAAGGPSASSPSGSSSGTRARRRRGSAAGDRTVTAGAGAVAAPPPGSSGARGGARVPGGSSGAAAPPTPTPPPPPPPLGTVTVVTESPNSAIVRQLVAELSALPAPPPLRPPSGAPPSSSSSSSSPPSSSPPAALCAAAVVVQSASPSADFSSLAAAPLLVLSASSFAWWPAFLGAARAVVAPRWGVAAPHAWAPDALAAPGVKVWQDMSLPPRASASASGEARGRDGVRRALLVAYAAAAPAGEGGESGAALDEESFPGGATGVAYAARATDGGRVLNVAVRGWGRWPGNTGEALARLRDC